MASRFDIVIFGATGFTGERTLPEVYKFAKSFEPNLTWGIAGRSEEKLRHVLVKTAERIGVAALDYISIIIADSNDDESLKRMTMQAKLIINCCGPYELYGEVVVKSCIETRTHYVDISVEPLFNESMELKYREVAAEKGVFVVNACGIGSVPADMGLVFLENSFEGTLNSVETYVCIYEEGGLRQLPFIHHGTWASLVYALRDLRKVICLKRNRNQNPLPQLRPKLSLRFPFRKELGKWAVGYPLIDRDILLRSQRYFYEHEQKRPIQVYCYGILYSFIALLHAGFLSFLIIILSQFQYGIHLLLQKCSFFSNGFVSHELSDEALSRHNFSYTFEGIGWSKTCEKNLNTVKPDKAIVGRVIGVNPGYGFTCTALALCAVVILTEKEKLPPKGGVYTTASVFAKTSLIKKLQENGAVFEILSIKDIQ